MNPVFIVIGQLVVWFSAFFGIVYMYAKRNNITDKLEKKEDIDSSPYQNLSQGKKCKLNSCSSPRKIKSSVNYEPFEYNIEY